MDAMNGLKLCYQILVHMLKCLEHTDVLQYVAFFHYLRREFPHPLCDGLIQHHFHLARILLAGNIELQVTLLKTGRLTPLHSQTLIHFHKGPGRCCSLS